MILPDRVRTNSPLAGWITKPQDDSVEFDKVCDAVFYYNCSPETGMKLAYYAKEI